MSGGIDDGCCPRRRKALRFNQARDHAWIDDGRQNVYNGSVLHDWKANGYARSLRYRSDSNFTNGGPLGLEQSRNALHLQHHGQLRPEWPVGVYDMLA